MPPVPQLTGSGRMATPEGVPEPATASAERPASTAAEAAPVPRRARAWRALTRPRVAVPAGALLYLLGMTLPWFSTPAYDAGFGYQAPASTVNGFDAGMLVVAAVLLVLAAVVTLLPSGRGPRLPFPRPLVPAALTTLCLLLTVPEWLTTFDRGAAPAGLLTVLGAAIAWAAAVRGAVTAVRAWPPPPVRPSEERARPADDDQRSDDEGSRAQGSRAQGSHAQGSDEPGSDGQGGDGQGGDGQGGDGQDGADEHGDDGEPSVWDPRSWSEPVASPQVPRPGDAPQAEARE